MSHVMTPERARARRLKLWTMEKHPATNPHEVKRAREARIKLEEEFPELKAERLPIDPTQQEPLVDNENLTDWGWIVDNVRGMKIEDMTRYLGMVGVQMLHNAVQTMVGDFQDRLFDAPSSSEDDDVLKLNPKYEYELVENTGNTDKPGLYLQVYLSPEDLNVLRYGARGATVQHSVVQSVAADFAGVLDTTLRADNVKIWKKRERA